MDEGWKFLITTLKKEMSKKKEVYVAKEIQSSAKHISEDKRKEG